ncbi:MAG: peptidase S41 [Chitinophagaceae bacterium]|nr:MAG: peptidase S41 [Chitinophagaceae bacterium]
MKWVILFLLLAPVTAAAQPCNCTASFEWLKKTIETNDAGFAYAIERKGEAAYTKHTAAIRAQLKAAGTRTSCAALMSSWMAFFRKSHWSITVKPGSTITAGTVPKATWEKHSTDTAKFRRSLQSISSPGFEGIWTTGVYTIGVEKKAGGYIGFILAVTGGNWKKDEIKFRIDSTTGRPATGTFYLGDYSAVPINSVTMPDANFLKMDNFLLRRVYPSYAGNPVLAADLELLSSSGPLKKKIGQETILVRIPGFDGGMKHAIDSIFTSMKDEITSTRNLVIDIRNNGGGNDDSYEKIIPLLYTNPIRIVGMALYSTTLNNKRMEGYLEIPDLSDKDRKEINDALATLNAAKGKFVNLGDSIVYTQVFDTVYRYPENVAIIVNQNNGSTAEQFLLAAKQSRKVKLFGTTTMGVLDISNMNFVDFPGNEFSLGYCLSKSFRIPEMAIDGIGIQPDYYMDKSIPQDQWIPKVLEIIGEKVALY